MFSTYRNMFIEDNRFPTYIPHYMTLLKTNRPHGLQIAMASCLSFLFSNQIPYIIWLQVCECATSLFLSTPPPISGELKFHYTRTDV